MPRDEVTPLPARPRWFGGGLAAAVLAIAAVVGYAAYWLAPPSDGERPTMPAAVQETGTAQASPGPALAGCTVAPRPDGSVVDLAGSGPTVMRVLPRQNNDPVHFEQPVGPADGEALFHGKPSAAAEVVADINATLAELTTCRFYLLGPDGRIELDGRYFALYSDDYFRGELAGYREAGKEPTIHSLWVPNTVATVVDARMLPDGRIAAVLATGTERYHPDRRWVAIFVRVGDRWLVDEVGLATFPSFSTPVASPVASATTAAAGATSQPWTPTVPLVLELAIFDAVPERVGTPAPSEFVLTHQSSTSLPVNLREQPTTNSGIVVVLPPATPLRWLGGEEADASGTNWLNVETESGESGWVRAIDAEPPFSVPFEQTTCFPAMATTVPCGEAFARHGPYWYNEFPADTDVTIRLHNVGTRSHRFVIKEFDVDLHLPPGERAEFVLNASVGTYLFLIFEDGGTTPIGAGTFEFIEQGQHPTAG
ncbi:MAG: SH3 domain-containing protein [Thermomicrobiales bacterium]